MDKVHIYDIINMYKNIPIDKTINVITNKLKNLNVNSEYITHINNTIYSILK